MDYRYTLANERTVLAYLRTALALDATALAVAHFLTVGPAWLTADRLRSFQLVRRSTSHCEGGSTSAPASLASCAAWPSVRHARRTSDLTR